MTGLLSNRQMSLVTHLLSVLPATGLFISVLRFLHLRRRIWAWLNITSLVGLCITFLGLTFVGNFQVNVRPGEGPGGPAHRLGELMADCFFWLQLFNQKTMHNVGTSMAFIVGILACWLQSYITLRADINREGKAAAAARLLLAGSTTACMILCILHRPVWAQFAAPASRGRCRLDPG